MIMAQLLRVAFSLLLLVGLLHMWKCYEDCPSGGFSSEKGLQRHQNSCRFAQRGFANSIAVSKRKLAAEKEEAAAKVLANEQAEAERQRIRDLEAEVSFLPDNSSHVSVTPVRL